MRIAQAVKTGLLVVMIAGTAAAQGPDDPPAAPQNGSQGGASTANPGLGGWRRIGDQSPSQAQAPYQGQGQPQGPGFGAPMPPLPAQLTIAPGTFLTIRVNQVLSSDRNRQGDAFSATLVKPVVVDGIVVADRGQTILGTVTEAKKAGLLHGSSHLGLQVTDMTLVDGHQAPVQTSFISRNGLPTGGRNAAVIGGTTAVGAGVGAVAAGGTGAAIGAGAGLAAGTLGALLTPGYPTLVYPEQVLTFRVENPIVISTGRAPQAFRPVGPQDYQQAGDAPRLQSRPLRPYYGPGYAYGPYPYYGYPYYPYYYGPGVGIGFGGVFYGGGRFRR
jgi:hypothetical protein